VGAGREGCPQQSKAIPVLANIWRISVLYWPSLCRLLNSSDNILQSSGLALQLMTGDSAPGGIAVEPSVHIVDFNIKRAEKRTSSQFMKRVVKGGKMHLQVHLTFSMRNDYRGDPALCCLSDSQPPLFPTTLLSPHHKPPLSIAFPAFGLSNLQII
jgi:hypothetical protein